MWSKHFSKGRPGALNSDRYYMSGCWDSLGVLKEMCPRTRNGLANLPQ